MRTTEPCTLIQLGDMILKGDCYNLQTCLQNAKTRYDFNKRRRLISKFKRKRLLGYSGLRYVYQYIISSYFISLNVVISPTYCSPWSYLYIKIFHILWCLLFYFFVILLVTCKTSAKMSGSIDLGPTVSRYLMLSHFDLIVFSAGDRTQIITSKLN